jgi:hypothetical protein
MTDKELLVRQIREDWGDKPQSEICIEILTYLELEKPQNLYHITHGNLRQIVDSRYEDIQIWKAVQYLCGDRTHVLEMKFELIDEDENIVELSSSDISNAEECGYLIHPETGEEVNNYKNKVYTYFEPSNLMNTLIGSK